ncbi:MAG: DUF1360 domain-containing protein [Bacteroidetes bacterium]|nr:DUF1360 domain-containing protein [Bacteroidota bacterium]
MIRPFRQDMFWYFLAVLSVWRISHLLSSEDGPFDLVLKGRMALRDSLLGKLFDCFYCLSIWIAIPFAICRATTIEEGIMMTLSLSALAIFTDRLIGKLL